MHNLPQIIFSVNQIQNLLYNDQALKEVSTDKLHIKNPINM